MIQDIAPKALLGYWNGRNDMMTNLAQAIAPLIFSSVYDGFNNTRGYEMLACTAAISFVATLTYAPLIYMWPPRKGKTELSYEKDEDGNINHEHYMKLSDEDYAELPLELHNELNETLLKMDKVPRTVSWGDYSKQQERWEVNGCSIVENGIRDFTFVRKLLLQILTDREALKQSKELFTKFDDTMPKPDLAKAKAEMGAWIADYFDDAGYLNWETQCNMYKAMIYNAFPPIDPLDNKKANMAEWTLNEYEDNLLKFLEVMDEHLATEERHLKPDFTIETLTTVIKRR